MTPLQRRLREEVLRAGPLFPWEIYEQLWPGRQPRCPGPTRGGPDTMSVIINRMMGRAGFRDLFVQDRSHLADPGGPGVSRWRNRESALQKGCRVHPKYKGLRRPTAQYDIRCLCQEIFLARSKQS